MRSNQQPGPDWNSGNSGIGSQFLGGSRSNGKQPWFGPKRFGWGYGPRTWQGFLVTALSVVAVVIAATVAKGSPWFYAVLIAVVAVHLVIIAIQRPR
ncbi:MAG TPA: hypothetical protein VMB74_16660 [Streptosporangiaceae bacterium]|nr:hypothetical protein [Streptosporangiaceae bacterium]